VLAIQKKLESIDAKFAENQNIRLVSRRIELGIEEKKIGLIRKQHELADQELNMQRRVVAEKERQVRIEDELYAIKSRTANINSEVQLGFEKEMFNLEKKRRIENIKILEAKKLIAQGASGTSAAQEVGLTKQAAINAKIITEEELTQESMQKKKLSVRRQLAELDDVELVRLRHKLDARKKERAITRDILDVRRRMANLDQEAQLAFEQKMLNIEKKRKVENLQILRAKELVAAGATGQSAAEQLGISREAAVMRD